MIKTLKKWIGKVASENMYPQTENLRSANRVSDMLSDSGAAFVGFKIDNGFLVRTMNNHPDVIGSRHPGFTYCADHQAIADHIVSSAVREKLGVQQELFGASPRKHVVVTKQTAGLVGAQQANSTF